jgi:hypothetical protein
MFEMTLSSKQGRFRMNHKFYFMIKCSKKKDKNRLKISKGESKNYWGSLIYQKESNTCLSGKRRWKWNEVCPPTRRSTSMTVVIYSSNSEQRICLTSKGCIKTLRMNSSKRRNNLLPPFPTRQIWPASIWNLQIIAAWTRRRMKQRKRK